jgi:hypothetical protein
VDLLHEATPPWPEQHAAYNPVNGLSNKKSAITKRFILVNPEVKLVFFIWNSISIVDIYNNRPYLNKVRN